MREIEYARCSPCNTFLGSYRRDALDCAGEGRWNRCLHPNLDCLKGTEANIGQELGRGGRGQIETGLPFFGLFLSHKARIDVLEVLIASILHRTLNGVAEERWAPASKNTSNTLSPAYLSPGLEIALV
jgi:hypothetical protein